MSDKNLQNQAASSTANDGKTTADHAVDASNAPKTENTTPAWAASSAPIPTPPANNPYDDRRPAAETAVLKPLGPQEDDIDDIGNDLFALVARKNRKNDQPDNQTAEQAGSEAATTATGKDVTTDKDAKTGKASTTSESDKAAESTDGATTRVIDSKSSPSSDAATEVFAPIDAEPKKKTATGLAGLVGAVTGKTNHDDQTDDSAEADADAAGSDAKDAEHEPTDEELAEIAARKRKRHVMITRGILTPLFGLLAVAAFVLGALNMTIWKPNPNVDIATGNINTAYIVTDPGVLALADNTVKLSAKADSASQVCLAVASPRDATGWLAGQTYTRVTQMQTWQKFATQQSAEQSGEGQNGADASSGSSVAFQDSDMWESVQCAQGTATLQWKGDGGDRVVIATATGADGSAASGIDFSMSWMRAQVPDYATPCFFVGGLLVLLAILTASIFSIEEHRRRKKQPVVEPEPEPEPDPDGKPHWMHPGAEPPAPSGRDRRRSRRGGRRGSRRHTRKYEEHLAEEEQRENDGPEVLDVTSVNLLQQNTPSVSNDELQAYFARLAAENAANDANENAAADADEHHEDGKTEGGAGNHDDEANKEGK
ncbi:hypothetical protein KIH77_02190 [Bifidobacterium sp. 82T24]|uniref:hypothetical protein n=1 Tax=Bifidobacterium pluvialisilvae TaxID=2834436 RepID=UPI001C564C46|nr:hypothetical protein [Bifidobacterium pluvialisilvae]MBW3087553.1 hypothetical protein [Bifidobacterium pluvialisilvae]